STRHRAGDCKADRRTQHRTGDKSAYKEDGSTGHGFALREATALLFRSETQDDGYSQAANEHKLPRSARQPRRDRSATRQLRNGTEPLQRQLRKTASHLATTSQRDSSATRHGSSARQLSTPFVLQSNSTTGSA